MEILKSQKRLYTPRFFASRKTLLMVKCIYMAFIRKFKTGSQATGVQVCYKEQGRVVKTIHVGSATSEVGLEKLLKKAQGIIDADKNPLFNLSKYDKK